ncbi:MAG: HEPN domain-containing protein [Spirochaetota bacterium]
MNQGIQELMQKADESIRAAEILLNDGLFDFSASRSYYAMFYVAEAALLQKDLSFSKHSGVIAAFGKEYIKTGTLPVDLHESLLEAFSMRNKGDYGASHSVMKEEAERLIEKSRIFISAVSEILT